MLKQREAGKLSSIVPSGERNRIVDLELVDNAGSYNLNWTYINVGDYNQDGLVGVSDLTPIGQYYEVAEGDPDWELAQLADGTVYIGCFDNSLYAISADGSLKWSYKTGGSVRSSPAIGADGTVYVGSDDGKLYAFGPGPG